MNIQKRTTHDINCCEQAIDNPIEVTAEVESSDSSNATSFLESAFELFKIFGSLVLLLAVGLLTLVVFGLAAVYTGLSTLFNRQDSEAEKPIASPKTDLALV